jgi:hypothetical protein
MRGGKLVVPFHSCDLEISQKEVSGNFEPVTTFAQVTEIYHP